MSRRTPRRSGPHLVITDEGHTRLLNAIRAGVPTTYAADYAGIGTRTLHRYLARGEDADARAETGETLTPDEERLRQIWLDVSRARADVAVRGVAHLQKVATGGAVLKETTRRYRDPGTGQLVTETERTYSPPDARPVQWLLERTLRSEFGRTAQQVELTGAEGGPVQVEATQVITSLADRLSRFVAERHLEIARPPEDEIEGEVVDEDAVPEEYRHGGG